MDFDPHSHAGALPSPCIQACSMEAASGYCRGCWRTLDEIGAWPTATEESRRAIWVSILQRRKMPGELGVFPIDMGSL